MSRYQILPELRRIPEAFRYGNAYLLKTEKGSILFDPAVPPEKVSDADEVKFLIATHGHYDHVASVRQWKERNNAAFWVAEQEKELLSDARANASLMFGQPTRYPEADRYLQDGEEIELDFELRLKIYNTPGHTKGSMCFLILRQTDDEEAEALALITGDTLFDDSFGRTDLASGDSAEMYRSLQFLRNLLIDLPASLPVCPGHGATVSAGELLNSAVWIFAETLVGR